jgi:hypothetical protein
MSHPEMLEKIAAATKAALADPDIKQRHVAGLKRRFINDPSLRSRVSAGTKAGIARWHAQQIDAAVAIAKHLPKTQRDTFLATLNASFGAEKTMTK